MGGVVSGTNLEGSEGSKIRQRERLNCEAVTKEASVYPRGTFESGMALQKFLELRQGGQTSVPLLQQSLDIGCPTLLLKKGHILEGSRFILIRGNGREGHRTGL